MVQRDHHIVDDVLGRDHQTVVLQSGQVITRKLVVDGAIVRYERPHPIWVQNVQGSDDAALIAFFQDVGVPMDQFAGDPVCEELDAVLVSVWAPQDRGEGSRFCFLPDTIGVLPNQTQPKLGNIVSDQRDAGKDCGVGEDKIGS